MGRFSIVLILALLTSVEASANPVVSEMLDGSPEAGPHVRLVYKADKTKSDATAPVLSCHGTTQTPWAAASDTSENTGSGMKPLSVWHMCDCWVPTGTDLKYAPVDKSSSFASTSVNVPAWYQRPPEPGSPCKTECELTDPYGTGGTRRADAALPEGSTFPKTEGSGGGSCTFAPAGRQATLPLLAFVAAIIVLWRRR